MTTRVHSLYIFDRHCNPVYYQDWTHLHQGLSAPLHPASDTYAAGDSSVDTVGGASEASASTSALHSISSSLRNATQALGASGGSSAAAKGQSNALRRAGEVLPNVTRSVSRSSLPPAGKHRESLASSGTGPSGSAGPSSSALPFDEQAKLVYGVVFSLRNMCRKLSGSAAQGGNELSPAALDAFSSYTTPTYTLTHFQSPTMYTFILLTDPLPSASGYGGSGAAGSSKAPAASSGGLISGYSISSRFTSSSGASASGAGGAGGADSSGAPGVIPGTGGVTLRTVLANVWKGPWVQHVARNPLCRAGLERSGEAERAAGVDSDGLRDAVEKLFAHYKLSAPPSVAVH